MKIVDDDDGGEFAFAEWPRVAGLEIGIDEFEVGPVQQVDNSGVLAVDTDHGIAAFEKQPRVPSGAAGDVEHTAARGDELGEAAHPR